MSGPANATSYEESVGSCGPPTPHTPPAPAAPRSAPVRRQLDFTGGGDLEGEDDEEFLCRVADDIERGYSEVKRRAPQCTCGREVCAVERDDQSGRWKYVCSSWPKCNRVAFCEEVDLDPKSLPSSRHPKPSNHMPSPRTPVNFGLGHEGSGAITPVSVYRQVAVATTLFSDSPQGAGPATLVNVSPHGKGAATLADGSAQGAGATTPAKFITQGVVATTMPRVSPQGARSNFETPICQCTAGKCRKTRIGEKDWYVCHLPKKKGYAATRC